MRSDAMCCIRQERFIGYYKHAKQTRFSIDIALDRGAIASETYSSGLGESAATLLQGCRSQHRPLVVTLHQSKRVQQNASM
jgi:hypothetical protein